MGPFSNENTGIHQQQPFVYVDGSTVSQPISESQIFYLAGSQGQCFLEDNYFGYTGTTSFGHGQPVIIEPLQSSNLMHGGPLDQDMFDLNEYPPTEHIPLNAYYMYDSLPHGHPLPYGYPLPHKTTATYSWDATGHDAAQHDTRYCR